MAIQNIKHGGLRRLFERNDASRLHAAHAGRIRSILALLDRPNPLRAVALPSYRLHRLTGDRKGFWSVRVSANWRIVFRVEGGGVRDVDLTDYHH